MNDDNISYLKSLLKYIGYLNEESISHYIINLETLYAGWDASKCIEVLKEEFDLKMFNNTQPKEIDFSKTITATDLSQYTFCPVSYSIGKSLKVDTPQSAIIGTSLHNIGLLARTEGVKKDAIESDSTKSEEYNLYEDAVIKKIINSPLIFSGHGAKKKQPFVNSKENYSGCPDYIFKDEDGKYFVVEEKFHMIKNNNENKYENFHLNHQLQIFSYIKNIQECKIDYGYLVYWYYDKDKEGNIYLFNVLSLEIRLNEEIEILYSKVKASIEELLTNRLINFDTSKLKQSRCVRCAVSKYCCHKNGRHKELTIPYSEKYIGLFLTGKTKFDYPVYVYAIIDFTNGDKTFCYFSSIQEFDYWDKDKVKQWLNKIECWVKDSAAGWLQFKCPDLRGENQIITVIKRETKQYLSRYRAEENLENEPTDGNVKSGVHGVEVRISC